MSEKYYPPARHRVSRVIVLSIATIFGISLVGSLFREGGMAICLGPMFLISVAICWGVGNLFPAVVIGKEHMRIYTVWGTQRILGWEDITEIRNPALPLFPKPFRKGLRRAIAIQSSRNIGLVYLLYGFMYDRGKPIVLLDPGQHRGEILSLLREYCPHAFPRPIGTEE
jgi:hypothetical protein